jgi:hypothetical protein
MKAVLTITPWLEPFQALRAMLWVLLALPVIRMMERKLAFYDRLKTTAPAII